MEHFKHSRKIGTGANFATRDSRESGFNSLPSPFSRTEYRAGALSLDGRTMRIVEPATYAAMRDFGTEFDRAQATLRAIAPAITSRYFTSSIGNSFFPATTSHFSGVLPRSRYRRGIGDSGSFASGAMPFGGGGGSTATT